MNTTANSLMIGRDMNTQSREPVRIGYDGLTSHMHILATTGSGKTTLKKLIFQQVVSAGHGCLFMTPAPDGIWEALTLVPKARLNKVILIDPADVPFPYASNLLYCPNKQDTLAVTDAVSRAMHVFKKIWGPGSRDASWGPQLENVLRNCLYALALNDLTLSELPYLLRDKAFRDYAVAGIPSAFRWTPWFWEEDFAVWQERLQIERTDSTLNKVLEFLTNPLIERIVGQKTNTLQLKRWINEEKIILVHLSENAPGLGDEAVKLLGTMLMAQTKEAVFDREKILDKNERKFFPVLIDEFQLFAGDDLKTLLDRARALNVPFFIGHQYMAQLESEALQEAVNQTAIKVTGRVTVEDARRFAPLYAPPVLAEEYEERKTEGVSGHRAVRTFQRDVTGHLLRQGHEDERVTAFRDDYLEKLHLHSLKKSERGFGEVLHPRNHLGIVYDPERLLEPLAELNSWLHTGMRQRDLLWKPLDFSTLSRLSEFFDFKLFFDAFHSTWNRDQPWHKIGEWHDPGFHLHKHVWYDYHLNPSGKSMMGQRGNTQAENHAAVEAVEDSLIGFIAMQQPEAAVRRVWQQKAIALTEHSVTDVLDRGLAALAQITGALRAFAETHPALDRTVYMRCFLAELSKPEYALEVFLPVITHASTHAGGRATYGLADYSIPRSAPVFSKGKAEIKTVGIHDPKLYKLALHQKIMERMPSYLAQLPAFLHFFATLHCAQLALSQNPIWTMDSGQYEPDKHTSTHFLTTPRQSPVETAGLMERELINLDPWTAWCRVQDLSAPPGEKIKKHKIAIPNPQPLVTGQALTQRIEAVRQQSRRLIAPRPASVVEAEIRGRVALLRTPAAAAGGGADVLPGAQQPVQPQEQKKQTRRRMGEV